MPQRLAKRTPRRVARKPSFPDTLRTSERNTLNRCRLRWHWGYNERWQAKRQAPALRFGTLIHKALELYYGDKNQARRKPLPPSKLFARVFDEELEQTQKDWENWRDENDEWHTYRELGMVMLDGYIEKYGPQDEEYVILALEQRFEMPIFAPPNAKPLLPESPTKYVGTLDRIMYHLPSRRLLLGDYKTTKGDPTKVGHLALDEQAGAYWAYTPLWLATSAAEPLRRRMHSRVAHLPPAHRRAVEELRFDGIMYDFLKKALPDERPVDKKGYALNKDGSVSKQQPGPLFHREPVYRDEGDAENVLDRIYEDAREIGMLRSGELAIKKSPDRFNCIGCQFIDMCELHETKADWQAFRGAMFEGWDPYSTYNIDADELG